ncbi:MAG: hypothetical protein WC082_00430 [Victivallales bacterium]
MTTGKKRKEFFKRLVFYLSIFIFFVFCCVKIVFAYFNNMGIDFTLFYSCTYAAMRGKDFFDVSNLVFHQWEEPLMVLPGLLIFYIPYMLLDIKSAHLLYFLLSLGASVFVYVWIFKLTGLLKKVDFRNPNLNALLFVAGAFVFLNSSPQLMCQRNGQVTIWVLLALLLFFTGSDKYRRTVWFGLSAVFKYSMITFFAPLLFIKKQYFICFGALTIFLIICAWPAFAGYNIIELYVRYAEVIQNTINGGCNSFELAGHDLLQFGFFRMSLLNLLGKAFFAITMLWILWRERDKEGIGLNLMLLVFCFTMLVSYHRLYDNIIVVLLLLVKINFLILRKDRFNSLICGAFLTFYMIPVSWIFSLADCLGGNPLLARIFYTSPFEDFQTVLPIIAMSQTLLGLYLLYLYLKSEDEYTFPLKTKS